MGILIIPITFVILILLFCVFMVVALSTGLDDKWDYLKGKKKELNQPYKCKCGIVSRKYQLLQDETLVCNHCGNHLLIYGDRTPDDRKFPFAPEISLADTFLKIRHEKKLKKVNMELHKLSEYDKEVEAWENIQLKKLKELEVKAMQIKAELANK